MSNKIEISLAEFNSVLLDPNITVVEKKHHRRFEYLHVIHVIENDEIVATYTHEIMYTNPPICFKEVGNV